MVSYLAWSIYKYDGILIMMVNLMSNERYPYTAFLLSLVGGILMLASGAMLLMMIQYVGYNFGFISGMMGGYMGMMGTFGIPFGSMWGLTITALIAGVIVIVGSAMLSARPKEHRAWGAVILTFSLISFLGMGGFYIGAILGIIGGTLAIAS